MVWRLDLHVVVVFCLVKRHSTGACGTSREPFHVGGENVMSKLVDLKQKFSPLVNQIRTQTKHKLLVLG